MSHANSQFVIFQRPNAPLLLWAMALVASWVISGRLHTILAIIAAVALAVWAVWEIFAGVNWLRRLIGAAVLGYLAFELLSGRLGH